MKLTAVVWPQSLPLKAVKAHLHLSEAFQSHFRLALNYFQIQRLCRKWTPTILKKIISIYNWGKLPLAMKIKVGHSPRDSGKKVALKSKEERSCTSQMEGAGSREEGREESWGGHSLASRCSWRPWECLLGWLSLPSKWPITTSLL